MSDTTTQDPNPHALRNFSALLNVIQDGELQQDLSDAVRKLVADIQDSARETGGKARGKIVLTVDLKYTDQMFDLNADFKITAPETPRRRTTMYCTPDNYLTRVNPRQMDLPLRTVATNPASELKAL